MSVEVLLMSKRLLAQKAVTAVEVCDCGCVYLTIGPVCLNLHASALVELRATIGQALEILDGERSPADAEPGEASAGGGHGEGGERDVRRSHAAGCPSRRTN